MWEISSNQQLATFMYSIILGIIFEILYDIFRAIRIVKPHINIIVLFEDIIYFSIIAIITFIFMLAVTNGELRGYVIIGIIVGFWSFKLLLSRYIIKPFILFLRGIFLGFSTVSNGFYWLFSKIDAILSKIFKNSLIFLKKGLKKGSDLLYTNRK